MRETEPMRGENIVKIRRGKKRPAVARSTRTVTPVARTPRFGGKLRLAIVTQPTLFRDILSRLLRQEPNFELVGQGHDEDHIVKVIKETTPDLLLFDYEALRPNSESIIGRLRRVAPRMRILVIATGSAN